MLLTIEADSPEISFLLHKRPEKTHTFSTNFGQAHVFYPDSKVVALLLEVDPLKLTRRGGSEGFSLQPYVNDRAYVASSFFSVALNQVFRSAVAGRCNTRPELVERSFELKAHLPVLPCRGGEALLKRLFEPLGYQVESRGLVLDERFPGWGDSVYHEVTLRIRTQLYRLLRHLYIMIPVLDNDKHYWVGQDEVDKLLTRGRDWLAEHPHRDLIVKRYLKYRRELTRPTMARLGLVETGEEDSEEVTERKIGLHQQRLDSVLEVLIRSGVQSVVDLGCGEGRLLRKLADQQQFLRILGLDVSTVALERAKRSLERLHPKRRERVQLLHGSLLYDDERLQDQEAAVLVEVIEHLEPDRLPRLAHNLFERMRPGLVVITTPNREYNVVWESLPAGNFRHRDHRFEWTRAEFRHWVEQVKGGYAVEFSGLGEEHPEYGAPTQMAVFRR